LAKVLSAPSSNQTNPSSCVHQLIVEDNCSALQLCHQPVSPLSSSVATNSSGGNLETNVISTRAQVCLQRGCGLVELHLCSLSLLRSEMFTVPVPPCATSPPVCIRATSILSTCNWRL